MMIGLNYIEAIFSVESVKLDHNFVIELANGKEIETKEIVK